MENNIKISVSQASLAKGVKDLSEMLHKQVPIKPEVYLPVITFLKEYTNGFNIGYSEQNESSVKYESTIVTFDKFAVVDGIEKIKKLLYAQTSIPAETYLVLFEQMDKFTNQLKTAILNDCATKNETEEQNASKQNDTSEKFENKKSEQPKQEQKKDSKALAWLFGKGEKNEK